MNRLKRTEVAAYRQKLAEEQGLDCALCGRSLAGHLAHLDHDHKTGRIRGVLHRDCNTLLGKIENFYNSYGKNMDLKAFMLGALNYLDRPDMEVYHPTYRTPEEKRFLRNKLAKRRRKKNATD